MPSFKITLAAERGSGRRPTVPCLRRWVRRSATLEALITVVAIGRCVALVARLFVGLLLVVGAVVVLDELGALEAPTRPTGHLLLITRLSQFVQQVF